MKHEGVICEATSEFTLQLHIIVNQVFKFPQNLGQHWEVWVWEVGKSGGASLVEEITHGSLSLLLPCEDTVR